MKKKKDIEKVKKNLTGKKTKQNNASENLNIIEVRKSLVKLRLKLKFTTDQDRLSIMNEIKKLKLQLASSKVKRILKNNNNFS